MPVLTVPPKPEHLGIDTPNLTTRSQKKSHALGPNVEASCRFEMTTG
jgi:hypothetical protein